MPYRVEIDRAACISSGACVADSPEAFAMTADGTAQPTEGATALDQKRLFLLARSCPAGAILVFDGQGAEVDVFATDL